MLASISTHTFVLTSSITSTSPSKEDYKDAAAENLRPRQYTRRIGFCPVLFEDFSIASRKLFLFDSSDIQRLVWRQIAGARLDNLLIPRRECARRLTESERMVFERYLSSDFRTSLREDLKNSLHDLEEGKMSLRAQVDAILI